MKILEKEIEFSFTNVDNIEKIDMELKRITEMQNKKFDDYIQELKFSCKIIKEFFDNVIEENFSEDAPNDYEYLSDEFDKFTSLYIQATQKSAEKLKKKASKYDIKRIKR